MFKIKNTIIITLLLGLFLPLVASAADIYFIIPSEKIYEGDVFPVEIRLDSQDSINAVQADVEFSRDKLEVSSSEKATSILRLWPEEPSYYNPLGLASFVGGLPDPGFKDNNGLLGIMYFRAKSTGVANIEFRDSTKVLLNDGKGTATLLNAHDTSLNILAAPQDYEAKVPVLDPDDNPPQSFTPIIARDDRVHEGKYFITFETVDLESGIDYFEIKEISGGQEGAWKRVLSPYLLENQSGKVKVLVKAVDRAGNFVVAEVEIGTDIRNSVFNFIHILAIIILLILTAIGIHRLIISAKDHRTHLAYSIDEINEEK